MHVCVLSTLCIVTALLSCDVGAGMVVDWEQETGLLMTSGDVRVIRIWDTDREMKVQVLYSPHLLVYFLCMNKLMRDLTFRPCKSVTKDHSLDILFSDNPVN